MEKPPRPKGKRNMTATTRFAGLVGSSEVLSGTWIQTNAPETCEIASRAGFDFVILDMEHGSFGIDSLPNLLRAVEAGGATAMVRVPDQDRIGIMKALDAGAGGILVPGVKDRAEVEAIVAATQYAPRGTRGACPATRGTGHGLVGWTDYIAWREANVIVSVLIETAEAVTNFEDIVMVEGLNAVTFGPFDLSVALGYGGDIHHPEVVRIQKELAAIALRHGVHVMPVIFASEGAAIAEEAGMWRALGARLIVASGDRFILSQAFRTAARNVK